jgi:ribosome-binding protein aMBF1 (putative translation factor)
MNKHIEVEHQIIRQSGKPAFAVVPYDQFLKLLARADAGTEEATIPHEVVKAHIEGGVSLVRAWREHLGLTQEELAGRAGMSQPAVAKLEASTARPRRATLQKLAEALGLKVEQLMA